jgi:hypothetical protein
MKPITPEKLRAQLFKSGTTRIRLCFETGLSRYRLYQFEKGMIELRAEEIEVLNRALKQPTKVSHP